jgi:hypothetical protein
MYVCVCIVIHDVICMHAHAQVSVFTVGAIPYMSEGGNRTGRWGEVLCVYV